MYTRHDIINPGFLHHYPIHLKVHELLLQVIACCSFGCWYIISASTSLFDSIIHHIIINATQRKSRVQVPEIHSKSAQIQSLQTASFDHMAISNCVTRNQSK